jgi:hypothetical protein
MLRGPWSCAAGAVILALAVSHPAASSATAAAPTSRAPTLAATHLRFSAEDQAPLTVNASAARTSPSEGKAAAIVGGALMITGLLVGGDTGITIAIRRRGPRPVRPLHLAAGRLASTPLEVIARLPKVAGAGVTATGNQSIVSHRASISERGQRSLLRPLHYLFLPRPGSPVPVRVPKDFAAPRLPIAPPHVQLPVSTVDPMTNDEQLIAPPRRGTEGHHQTIAVWIHLEVWPAEKGQRGHTRRRYIGAQTSITHSGRQSLGLMGG